MRLPIIILFLITSCTNARPTEDSKTVRVGAEILIERHLDELSGKQIGLVMNPTARINGVHVLDTLLSLNQNITALFAPEHGFRGNYGAGETIAGGIDLESGLPVYSLYGQTRKPTPEMLENVDLLLFDMQDVGARFYTYISTMKLIIEAAAENEVEVWILDRPNPAGGEYVAGWVMQPEYESFVGMYPIPVAHGLTMGELALMAMGEGWLDTELQPAIKVIEMEGWKRTMKWPDTGLEWIPPSPNLPTFDHALVYLGTCFIEGTTLSEGRGTNDPFLTLGAKSFQADIQRLNQLSKSYHIQIDTIRFTPRDIPGKALNPKFEGEEIPGIRLTPGASFSQPVEFGVEITRALIEMSDKAEYNSYMKLLTGTEHFATSAIDWGKNFTEFLDKRTKYLLY